LWGGKGGGVGADEGRKRVRVLKVGRDWTQVKGA